MGYVIRQSWGRRLVAAVLLAGAAFAVAPILYAYLRVALPYASGAMNVLLVGGVGAGLCSAFALLAWRSWCHACDRRVCGIRLMGGPRALLYFPAVSSCVVPPTTAPRAAKSAASVLPPVIPFPYDGHPAIAVTITRLVHWPGCLLSLTFDSASPADAALDRLAGPRSAPRVRPLLGGWPPWSRRRVATIPMRSPRHVLIFADAMPAPQFRSLAISLACLQRGVTFVEHR